MTRIILLFLLSIANIGISQENDSYQNLKDSLLQNSLSNVTSINKDSISSLLIYQDVKYQTAKGFLIENNIPGGIINITDSIPFYPEECNVRMRMTSISDSTFYVEYKLRASKSFITDTCFVFSFRHTSYIAIPVQQYKGMETLADLYSSFLWGPASTDERDVVQICITKTGQTVFYPL